MLLLYTDPTLEPEDPTEIEKMMGDYLTFTQEILESKEMVSGERLQGTDTATAVRVRGARTSTTDGPFAETKEHLGGYYLVDVPDLDRAIELAAKIPAADHGVVEVRPIFEMG
jgi:hypothetical protein